MPEIIMDIEYVKKMCENLGNVKKFRKDNLFFGNIELEIVTPNKNTLSIVSDRGVFSCYIDTQKPFKGRRPIETVIKSEKTIEFSTLEAAVDFLKKHFK